MVPQPGAALRLPPGYSLSALRAEGMLFSVTVDGMSSIGFGGICELSDRCDVSAGKRRRKEQ